MKKTLIKLCSVAAIGLALTACNNDAANKQAQDADNAAIDQLVQDKVKTLDDSLTKVCEDKITLAAEEKLKSEPAPKGGHAASAHHAKPATTPKKEEPKKPATVGNGKPDMNGGGSKAPGTVGNGKPDMNGGAKKDPNTVGNGKPKM